MGGPVFSQPSPDGFGDADSPAPPPESSTLISMAAQLAHTLGNREGVRDQLPEDIRGLFDLSYSVQAAKLEAEGVEKKQRLEQMTDQAYERMIANDAAKRRRLEDEATNRRPLADRILDIEALKRIPQPAPLVRDLLYTGSVAVFLGDSQVAKTWVALSVAAAAASGMPWPRTDGFAPPEPISVLYVAAEDGGVIGRRLTHWERAHGRNLNDTGRFFSHPEPINILDPVQIEEMAEVIRQREFRLVIIDTVAASLGGEEEGNPQFSLMVRHMRTLLAAMGKPGSVILIHHLGKDRGKGGRGGSSLFADSDIVWEFDGTMDSISLKCKKWKAGPIRKPIRLHLDRKDPDAVHIAPLDGDDGSGNMTAEDPRQKYALLAHEIVKYVRNNSGLNGKLGPSGRQIIGALRESGCQARTATIYDQIAAMTADGRLVTNRGPRNATCYHAPVQDKMFT